MALNFFFSFLFFLHAFFDPVSLVQIKCQENVANLLELFPVSGTGHYINCDFFWSVYKVL